MCQVNDTNFLKKFLKQGILCRFLSFFPIFMLPVYKSSHIQEKRRTPMNLLLFLSDAIIPILIFSIVGYGNYACHGACQSGKQRSRQGITGFLNFCGHKVNTHGIKPLVCLEHPRAAANQIFQTFLTIIIPAPLD